ncbi:MAG TPA: NAD(P)/FAD-dependent oxidoreductase [Bryobacteraceae bacterium]|nr:NAD(P)/FAD-dependent oxidoreductase [Bryobacteraceae bacterium]
MANHRNYDAIVIGGGPAGSTAAAILASEGHRVLVLEKEKFPRYHIGESLLPYCYFTLARLGMLPRMKASPFVRKYSVQFVDTEGKASLPFYFFQHLKNEASCTWQVLRSEFDQMLLDNAREKGAEVREETTVRELIRENGAVAGVQAVSKSGAVVAFHAPVTIDASGRDAFAVTRNEWKVRDPFLNKISIWTYYRGAMRDPGVDEGATTIAYVPEKGWFWYVPLHDDVVSVGVVAEKNYLYNGTREPAAIFHREVEKNAWLKEHLAPGTQFGSYRVTGEYSYRSRHCAANGLILAGDAFAFLDPVFSSGVFLALRSGEMAADAVHAALNVGDFSASRFSRYGMELCQGIEAMRKLVYAFYEQAFSFSAFVNQYPHLKGDVTDCLIGNLFRDFDPLFSAVAKFAKIPEPLAHGKALLESKPVSCL